MKRTASNHPTEIASGVALATAVTAALAPAVPISVAAVAGVVSGFGPIVLTRFVAAFRR